jgi:hypothetical protein
LQSQSVSQSFELQQSSVGVVVVVGGFVSTLLAKQSLFGARTGVDVSIAHDGWEGTNVTGSSLIFGISGTRTANLVGLVGIVVLEYRVTGRSLVFYISGTRAANLVGLVVIVILEHRVTSSSLILGIRSMRTTNLLGLAVIVVVLAYRVQQKSAPYTSQSPCQRNFLMTVGLLGCSRHGVNYFGCVCDVVP